MIFVKQLWYRLMGNTVRSEAQWRAWAIEQAIKSGAEPYDVECRAAEFLLFVSGPVESTSEPERHWDEGLTNKIMEVSPSHSPFDQSVKSTQWQSDV